MKNSNVSFENLLDQLSEEKINRVVDREALRAGGLELILGGGGGGCASSTGSGHTKTHSSTTSSANCCGGGLFGLGL